MPGSCEYPFFNLWFQATGNRIRVYRVSSRRSIHSTTDRYTETDFRRKRQQHLRVCAYCKGFCRHAYSAILIGHIFVKRVNRKEKSRADWTNWYVSEQMKSEEKKQNCQFHFINKKSMKASTIQR